MTAVAAVARPQSLDEWLQWQASLHPREIELGLDRVRAVADRLGVLPPARRSLIIAGTNGKGSCALALEALCSDSCSTGVYTSPHLLRYNERIRQGRTEAADDELCDAFAAVEAARAQTPLTYFEFGTLAAFWLFRRVAVDTAILEVGLGGRLDAVNLVDADVALVTNIGLDHSDWLGSDREAIGREKAGVMRAKRPVVIADRRPPKSLLERAGELDAPVYLIGRDFELEADAGGWTWRDWQGSGWRLPSLHGLLPDNLAASLAAATLLGFDLSPERITACLGDLRLPGRRQVVDGSPSLLFDVGHNAEAMAVLAEWLQAHPIQGQTHLVIGMLKDKPVEQATVQLAPWAGNVHAAGLDDIARGLSAEQLAARLPFAATPHKNVSDAVRAAHAQAGHQDRIVVCGSFYTVAAAIRDLQMESLG